MGRIASAVVSGAIAFSVAYLVGSKLRDRRTGLWAGTVSGSMSAAINWVVYGLAESARAESVTRTTSSTHTKPE